MTEISFKHTVLLYVLFCCFIASSNSITLSISPSNVTFSGNAIASSKNNTFILTQDRNCTSSSSSATSVSRVGRVFYKNPVRFLDSSTKAATSFLCKFSFSITSSRSCPYGDGFAFVFTSNTDSLNLSEGYMGLPKQPLGSQDSFLAVEFDTSLDHINGSHVGINVNSNKTSAAKTDASTIVELKSGHNFTSWIEYNDSIKMIQVWVGNSSSLILPSYPILVAQIDLSREFKEFMRIGFSASNKNGSAVYAIEQWEFETLSFRSLSNTKRNSLYGHQHYENYMIYGLFLAFGTLAAMIFAFTLSFLAIRYMYNY